MRILEEIMSNHLRLINNIKRAEASYRDYCEAPNYHHAMHIFYANKEVYDLLNLLLEKPEFLNYLDDIFNYIFHLEDWFLQFKLLEKDIIDLEQEFKFMPLNAAIPYPKKFLRMLEI